MVLTGTWDGNLIGSTTGSVGVKTSGPKFTIRYPGWTAANSHEDMPVMVFTPDQWELILSQKLAVGAAPIPPSKLGQNSKYVFALPARYNFDYNTGWEEVDQLVHKLSVFEPTL